MLAWTRHPQLVVVVAVGMLCTTGLITTALVKPPTIVQWQAPQITHPRQVLSFATPVVDCIATPCMGLTFDDGPQSDVTPRILDILAAHHARATFFVVGSRVEGNEFLLQRMHTEGHEIGNHTWSHHDLTKMPPEQVSQEVFQTQAAITRAGVPAPKLFRAPYGSLNESVKAHIPLTIIGWNVDPEDWKPDMQGHIVEHAMGHAKRGAVIIMHDTEPTTADQLDRMLAQLEGQYRFVPISELLTLTPGQRGFYHAR